MDVQTPAAESSTAAVEEQQPTVEVPRDPEAYAEWRMTGKLQEKKVSPSKDDSATSEQHSAVDKTEKGAPAPEAGKGKQARDNAETRKEQLNAEIRDLLKQRDTLRTEVDSSSKGKTDVKAEPSPAPRPESGPKAPVKPDYKKIREEAKSWEDGETAVEEAREKYYDELTDYKSALAVQNDRMRQQQENQTREMQTRLEDAKKRYGAEAESQIVDAAKTVFNDQAIPQAVKLMLGRSPVITDLLFVMGSNAGEFAQFIDTAKRDPAAAIEKLILTQQLVKEELAKGSGSRTSETAGEETKPPRGEDGKFQPAKPAKQVSSAPPPPEEVSGRRQSPPDEVQGAISANDFSAYREAQNRRDVARKQGR